MLVCRQFAFFGHHLHAFQYRIHYLSLLVAAKNQVYALHGRNLFGFQLGIAPRHHNNGTRMVPDQTMYGLAALAVRHLCNATCIYHTYIRNLTLASGPHTTSLQFCTHGTRLREVQFAAQGVIHRFLVLKHIHVAKVRLSERNVKYI